LVSVFLVCSGCSSSVGFSSFGSVMICPPACWIFLAAFSEYVSILIVRGLVIVPVASSFWYPRAVRSM